MSDSEPRQTVSEQVSAGADDEAGPSTRAHPPAADPTEQGPSASIMRSIAIPNRTNGREDQQQQGEASQQHVTVGSLSESSSMRKVGSFVFAPHPLLSGYPEPPGSEAQRQQGNIIDSSGMILQGGLEPGLYQIPVEFRQQFSEYAQEHLVDLPAGIHSGNVTHSAEAFALFGVGRGLGSGMAGSAEETNTFTAVAPSVLRRAVEDDIPEGDEYYAEDDPAAPLLNDGSDDHYYRGRTTASRRTSRQYARSRTRHGRSRTPPPRAISRPMSRRTSFSGYSRPVSEAGLSGLGAGPGQKGAWSGYVMLTCLVAYLAAAAAHDAKKAAPLLVIAGAVVGFYGTKLLVQNLRDRGVFSSVTSAQRSPATTPPTSEMGDELGITKRLLQTALAVAVSVAAVTTFVMLDILPYIHKEWQRLVSLGGIAVFILICVIFSDAPKAIVWRPVFWGLSTQFVIALMTLKWPVGFKALNSMGDGVMKFLSFAEVGAKFLYGDSYKDHYFAFVVLSITIFFGAFLGVLYHIGVVQVVIDNMSYIMQKTFQISGVDAITAVGNMIVGPCESALLVKPFLFDLTRSELQSVMISGMGSVSGGGLGAYISYGIPIDHVLVAIFLSAPCSIMVAKLLCPEREESKADKVACPPGECTNVVEAAAQGAADCIPLCLNIGGIMLAFISLLALMDSILGVLGSYVGFELLSFNLICSYVFRPLVFLTGVPWADCGYIAELLGTRLFLNEFVAYEALGEHMKAGLLQDRSVMLGTYALCGYSNMATIGVLLGGLSPLIPGRSQEIAEMSFRAILGGTITCLITSCVAGFVVQAV